jgi:two-component system, NtrC family, sensor kinase
MRLVLKLTIGIALAVSTVRAVDGYSRVVREIGLLESDMKRDHLVVARTVAWALRAEAERRDINQALELLQQINQQDARIEVAWRSGPADERAGPTYSTIAKDTGEHLLVTTVPLVVSGDFAGAIELRESMAPLDDVVRATIFRAAQATLATVAVCTLLIIGLFWLLVGRPIRLLVQGFRRVGAGDLTGRVRLQQRDEIGALASEFDLMCDQLASARGRADSEAQNRIATLEQLRHAERLSTVGRLASGVAHELGTPLNVVLARAKMITRGESKGEDTCADAQVIVEQVDRISSFTRQLLDFARTSKARKEPTDIASVARNVVELLRPLATSRQVRLELEASSESTRIAADPRQIQQVLINIVMNAVQAQPDGGEILLSVDRVTAPVPGDPEPSACDWVRVRTTDQGLGMGADTLSRAFEPFFSTKRPGEGTGLGLSVAQEIVREHGGTISVQSELGKGTEVTVLLPIDKAS